MADPIASNSQAQNSSGFFQSLYDGMIKGDFSSNNSKTKIASQIGVGIVPGLGQVADARDTYAAIRDVSQGKPSAWNSLGFSLLGWVPLAGDFAKSINKIGFKNTLEAVGDSFRSIKNTWKELTDYVEPKMGEDGLLFYKPATNMRSTDLDYDTLGATNRWGDIEVRDDLYNFEKQSTFDHENVHRFFSPKFKYGQEFRANLRFLGYIESHLLKRTEEGLAEVWSSFKQNGLKGIKEAWNFPYTHNYGIDPDRLKVERNILLGLGSTSIGTGAAIGNSLKENEK